MSLVSGIVIFVIIWWIIFFIALPVGIKREKNLKKGQNQGAPKNPYLGKKVFWTTLVSIVLFVIVWWVIELDIVNFRQLAQPQCAAPQ